MSTARARHYWLLKSEPDSFSFDDLLAAPAQTTCWDGVRNYQARNFMRDEMKPGDEVLFYHSSTNPPGVVGLAKVVRSGYPDPSALDPGSHYFDEKASEEDPRWYMVDIEFVEKFPALIPLATLGETAGLEKMLVNNRSRLSVQPVTPEEFEIVKRLGQAGS